MPPDGFNANEVLMIGVIFATEVGGAVLGGRLLLSSRFIPVHSCHRR